MSLKGFTLEEGRHKPWEKKKSYMVSKDLSSFWKEKYTFSFAEVEAVGFHRDRGCSRMGTARLAPRCAAYAGQRPL